MAAITKVIETPEFTLKMPTDHIVKISNHITAALLDNIQPDYHRIQQVMHTPAQQNTQLHWVQPAHQSQQVSQQITSYPQCKLLN